jgi:hypothetical protein
MVEAGGHLILDTEAWITGNHKQRSGNDYSGGDEGDAGGTSAMGGAGVWVKKDGTLTMHGGGISGNTTSSSEEFLIPVGGGVFVQGTLKMYGGKIEDNTATYGGGVFVGNTGTFTKASGGEIFGNSAGGGQGIQLYIRSTMTSRDIPLSTTDNWPE